MELTGTAVEELYASCLFADDELPEEVTEETLPENAIVTEGVLNRTAFKREHIEARRGEIVALLDQLPREFFPPAQGGGGGWSFLNGCMRADGEQWTGLHRTQDMLFQLGRAIGAVKYPLPRVLWPALPGAMPYIVVDTSEAS